MYDINIHCIVYMFLSNDQYFIIRECILFILAMLFPFFPLCVCVCVRERESWFKVCSEMHTYSHVGALFAIAYANHSDFCSQTIILLLCSLSL